MNRRHVDAGRLTAILLLTPFLLWLVCLILLPHLGVAVLSLREKVGPRQYAFGFGNYARFFAQPIYWQMLLRTTGISLLVTALTLVAAFPVAWTIAKVAAGRSKAALFLFCLLPLWVSDLVRAFGWVMLLRETGIVSRALQWSGLASGPVELLYNDAAVVVCLVYTVILFMIVPLVSTLEGMDDNLIEAASNLGGSRFDVFRRVVIPYAMPGIVSGSILVFTLTAGSYLTPILIGGKNASWFTEQIYAQFITRFNWEMGSTFGILLLVFTSALVWLALRLSGQSLATTVGGRA
ncbi:ABC transporter permease [Aureimonas leprariae]|uniref:ABC transporter permease n=1 Tax=Plantimonas leprariae TaxID=2615207 RepID=A0A7V7TV74_9HYPH|nr:ABC transporter permease [Aureimonas leprariae]KAB0677334.1 ABC transporter permease [Aureimonas leprariae]